MNTTIRPPEAKLHDVDLDAEAWNERGVTAPAISPRSKEMVGPGPTSPTPSPQTGARLERWMRGSFLRWLSLILFLLLLDVTVLLPLLTPATH
jgi:hypothetical protein